MAEKRIDGGTYRVRTIPASDAVLLAARLAQVAGPAIAALREGGQAGMAAALGSFAADMDPIKIRDLMVDLCEKAEIKDDGGYTGVIFDQHFTGHLKTAAAVTAFVVQSEFGDFFPDNVDSGPEVTAG